MIIELIKLQFLSWLEQLLLELLTSRCSREKPRSLKTLGCQSHHIEPASRAIRCILQVDKLNFFTAALRSNHVASCTGPYWPFPIFFPSCMIDVSAVNNNLSLLKGLCDLYNTFPKVLHIPQLRKSKLQRQGSQGIISSIPPSIRCACLLESSLAYSERRHPLSTCI